MRQCSKTPCPVEKTTFCMYEFSMQNVVQFFQDYCLPTLICGICDADVS